MNKKHLLCCVLYAFIVTGGCGKISGGRGNAAAVWNDIPFPIAAWIAFDERHLDEEHFRQMADAGFTISSAHYGDARTNLRALDLAGKVGLKLVVVDRRIQPDKPVDEKALRLLDEVCEDYSGHPAFFGYLVRDEPSASVFSFMAGIKERLLLRDPRRLAFGNLFPDYASETQLGTRTYSAHVDSFIRVFKPQILSYDYYPYTNSGFRQSYYANLELIRKAAMSAGIPFWAFTMSCEIDPAYPRPREAWMRLQVYTDLAYGAKGIQYFSYGVPYSDMEKFTIAVIDTSGNPTYIYDIARRINSEILTLAPVLNELEPIGVFHTHPLPDGAAPIPGDFIAEFDNALPLTVGEFRDKRNSIYLLIVNREDSTGGESKIRLSAKASSIKEIDRRTGAELPLELRNNTAAIRLDAGDGKLYKVEW